MKAPRARRHFSMPHNLARGALPRDGFTLFETLIAVALTGLILSILSAITAQWIPNWRAGFTRLQTADLASLALDRLTSDLAAAEFVAPIGQQRPLFYGSASAVTFVRSPLGPRPSKGPAPTGLEIVRFADSADAGGLVRSRVPFSPENGASAGADDFEFSDASLLLRAPLHVSFDFAGHDRVWTDSWSDQTVLPSAVRITLRNANSDQVLAISTATLAHITAPGACALKSATSQCLENKEKSAPEPAPGADQAAPKGVL
ncbi:PulJ/GspJ family protein [Methylocella sp.]|jgi:general secretion pathway protein J|uniref:PulJ/GspJ family protein n=1 Tax=Methylocella sp. TaxID=1978226 RepID=UPI003C231B6C